MGTIKVPMEIDKDHLETAPDYLMNILDEELRETNKLIDIRGYSRCYPNGEIEYDTYTLVFLSATNTVRIYRTSKWVDMPTETNMIWLDKKDLQSYLDIMKGVKF